MHQDESAASLVLNDYDLAHIKWISLFNDNARILAHFRIPTLM